MEPFRGTFSHSTRGNIDVQMWQEGERSICVVLIGARRFEQSTDSELWGQLFQEVYRQAVDSPAIEAMPRSKLVKRVAPPVTPPRRRVIRSISSPPTE
jgi:hypothetical protein